MSAGELDRWSEEHGHGSPQLVEAGQRVVGLLEAGGWVPGEAGRAGPGRPAHTRAARAGGRLGGGRGGVVEGAVEGVEAGGGGHRGHGRHGGHGQRRGREGLVLGGLGGRGGQGGRGGGGRLGAELADLGVRGCGLLASARLRGRSRAGAGVARVGGVEPGGRGGGVVGHAGLQVVVASRRRREEARLVRSGQVEGRLRGG